MKKIFNITAIVFIIIGIFMISGGIFGIGFTHKNVVREKIITPQDSSIPGVLVAGPSTLKAQADIIRKHTLESTSEKVYSEMPREIAQVDKNGSEILDKNGKIIMKPNTARDIWITATTLSTALNLGIIAYAFFILVLFLGIVFTLLGIIFCFLSKKH